MNKERQNFGNVYETIPPSSGKEIPYGDKYQKLKQLEDNLKRKRVPENLNEVKILLSEREAQIKILEFVNEIREDVESPEKWKKACLEAAQEFPEPLIKAPTLLEELLEITKPLSENCPPGHDGGHVLRDLLTGIVLANSDLNALKIEKFAGIIGAAFHDISLAVFPRYKDLDSIIGHGEVSAWLTYKLLSEMTGEKTAKLIAYSIAAHTHYLKPVGPEGYERQPYTCEPFVDKESGLLIWVSPLLTRQADRMDTGSITHFSRHAIAEADAYLTGGGKNLSGDLVYEFSEKTLQELFSLTNPYDRTTLLGHVLSFALSNFGNTVYSKHDNKIPLANEIFGQKTLFLIQVVTEIMGSVNPGKEKNKAINDIRRVFFHISHTPVENFEPTWELLKKRLEKLDSEALEKWHRGILKIENLYPKWLDYILEKIKNNNPNFKELAEEIVEELKN